MKRNPSRESLMPVLDSAIQPLARDDLASGGYERFARSVFGLASFEAHVEYCRWLYDRNPATESAGFLPIYVCREGDSIVGQLGIIPVRIVLDGASLRSGWCVDFFILPSHQRRGIGRGLLSAAHADFPMLMSLGQTDASRALFLKCGWRVAGAMRIYKRFLRPLRCVTKKALASAGIATGLAEHAPSVSQFTNPFAGASEGDAGELRGIRARETCVVRTGEFMQWRYGDTPGLAYRILPINHGTERVSYAVWRVVDEPPLRRGLLVDLVYSPDLSDADLPFLLARVTDCMRSDGIDVLECQTSDLRVLAALPGGPFATQQPGARFVYGGMDGTVWPTIPADQWRLYAGDCDVDALHARGGGS